MSGFWRDFARAFSHVTAYSLPEVAQARAKAEAMDAVHNARP